MHRLVEYIARCPFSLTRMVALTPEGKVLYRAGQRANDIIRWCEAPTPLPSERSDNPKCFPFPKTGDEDLAAGIPRNYEVFEPLDFLAEVTQHIPNKGEHQIRFYGWYSNKSRGMRAKRVPAAAVSGMPELVTEFSLKRRMTWAMLIKAVYEVDPLKCPACGGTMKVISLIDQDEVIGRILRHCGLWKDPAPPRAPPITSTVTTLVEPVLDHGFFENTCI